MNTTLLAFFALNQPSFGMQATDLPVLDTITIHCPYLGRRELRTTVCNCNRCYTDRLKIELETKYRK